MESKKLLFDLLNIPSPTFDETEKADFLQQWCQSNLSDFVSNRIGNNLTFESKTVGKQTLAFVGHMDSVPSFFKPFEKNGRMYGSGASDMQAGLASMLCFINRYQNKLLKKYSVKIILYDKEEGTSLHQNGLNELIKQSNAFFSNIDLAIVAEPTNNAIQLGCVGSIHVAVNVKGKAAHSARPWHGDNALYRAIPLIQAISAIKPKKQTVFGVDFYDVLSITESQSSPGRTTIPDQWTANINYRFSPVYLLKDAENYVVEVINQSGIENFDVKIVSSVDAGVVVDHSLLQEMRAKKLTRVEAKQAWTDVAQLTGMGICAINFGPGCQKQAHQANEYVVLEDMVNYEELLNQYLLGGKL